VQPRLCSDTGVSRLEQSNVPVGLIGGAEYTTGTVTLRPGWRTILVSDGITEAEDAQGEFFGDERLDSASFCGDLSGVLQRMADFCAGHPANDDCTIVEVVFSGPAGDNGRILNSLE
jgi:sigma-B regulation protein RsbU (phosphoserine phosphatase)